MESSSTFADQLQNPIIAEVFLNVKHCDSLVDWLVARLDSRPHLGEFEIRLLGRWGVLAVTLRLLRRLDREERFQVGLLHFLGVIEFYSFNYSASIKRFNMLRGNKSRGNQIESESLIDLVLVADHVRSIRYLDATIRQLLHSTSIDELSENLSCSVVVLHFFFGSSELYLKVSDLHLVFLFHLIEELLLVALALKLFFGSASLRADLEEVSSITIGRYI